MSMFDYNIDPTKTESKLNKAIYVWIDILGFGNILMDEKSYSKLYNLLIKFRELFNGKELGNVHIVSDGLLIVKHVHELKTGDSLNDLINYFKSIGQLQWEFLNKINFEHNLRGGFAIGSFMDRTEHTKSSEADKKNDYELISNGLSKAYRLESRDVSWPIIGTTSEYLKEIRKEFLITNPEEYFNLKKTYNRDGNEIFFIDFLKEENSFLSKKIVNEVLSSKSDYRSKYLWLYHYYRTNLVGADFTTLSSEKSVL